MDSVHLMQIVFVDCCLSVTFAGSFVSCAAAVVKQQLNSNFVIGILPKAAPPPPNQPFGNAETLKNSLAGNSNYHRQLSMAAPSFTH